MIPFLTDRMIGKITAKLPLRPLPLRFCGRVGRKKTKLDSLTSLAPPRALFSSCRASPVSYEYLSWLFRRTEDYTLHEDLRLLACLHLNFVLPLYLLSILEPPFFSDTSPY